MCHIYNLYQLNSFHANVLFLYPLKSSKTSCFLTFSGGTEKEHWRKMQANVPLYFSGSSCSTATVTKTTIHLNKRENWPETLYKMFEIYEIYEFVTLEINYNFY